MRLYIRISVAAFCCAPVLAFSATSDQAAVHVRYSATDPSILVVEGITYTLHLDCQKAMITRFAAGDEELIGAEPLMAMMSTGKVNGPGRVVIRRFGPHMVEIRLRDLQWNNLDADIQLVLYCYGKRVYCNLVVDQRQAPQKFWMGWLGSIKYGTILPYSADELDKYLDFGGARPKSVAMLPPVAAQGGPKQRAYLALRPVQQRLLARYEFTEADLGTRTTVIVLAAGGSHDELRQLVQMESSSEKVVLNCAGGNFRGYQRRAGYFLIDAETTAAVSVEATVSSKETILTGPCEIVCCVASKSGDVVSALLTDGDYFALPVPVQISRVSSDPLPGSDSNAVTEAFFPLTVLPDRTTQAHAKLLHSASVGHGARQLASVESNDPVLQSTLGGVETFRYQWLGRSGNVGGQSIDFTSARATHSLLRYRSGGNWIDTRLERARIFLTGPTLANFALDTLSVDGKIESSIEITETSHDDYPRAFIKLLVRVRDTVEFDTSSAHDFRILESLPSASSHAWDSLAYTGESGETIEVGLTERRGWILEAAKLGAEYPIAAACSRTAGSIAYVVNRVTGTLGGWPLSSLGLSCAWGERGVEVFLTTPDTVSRLEKGDQIEAHLFIMTYEDADAGAAETQRDVFGGRIPTVGVEHGTPLPGYPRRLRCDSRGFTHFTVTGGHNWTPLLVEGFATHTAPMLWEKSGELWRLVELPKGRYFQSYRDQAGTVGFVFALDLRLGDTRELFLAPAPNARRIEMNEGTVRIEGNEVEFISPVRFNGLDCVPLEGTAFYRCNGVAGATKSE